MNHPGTWARIENLRLGLVFPIVTSGVAKEEVSIQYESTGVFLDEWYVRAGKRRECEDRECADDDQRASRVGPWGRWRCERGASWPGLDCVKGPR